MANDPEATVRTLLSSAGLELSAEELANLTLSYPGLRQAADALYRPDIDRHQPASLPAEPDPAP